MSRDRGNNLNGAEGAGGASVEPAGRRLALALRGNFGVCTAGKGKKINPTARAGTVAGAGGVCQCRGRFLRGLCLGLATLTEENGVAEVLTN